MNALTVTPDALISAAAHLDRISSDLHVAHTAAIAPTVHLTPAADEVSTAITKIFTTHAADYHTAATQATAYGDAFTTTLKTGAAAYSSTDHAAAFNLQRFEANLQGCELFLQSFLQSMLTGFETDPLEYAAGTVLFFVLIPFFIAAIPLILLGAIIAAA